MTTTTNEPRNVEAELAKGFKARLGRIIDNAKAMERDLGDQSDPAANKRKLSLAACRQDVEEDQEALANAAVAGVLFTVERFVEEIEHRRRVLLRLLDKYPDRLPWPKEVLRRIAPRTALPRSFPALRHLLSIDPVDEWKPFAYSPDLAPLECVRWGFERLGIPGTPDVALLDATIQQPGLLHDREADTHNTDQLLAGSHLIAGLHHATIALVAHAAMLETLEVLAREAAREILDEAKKENDKLAHEERALKRLELATWEHLVKVRKAIGLPLSVDEMRALGGRDGLYELDARLVPELQRIGDAGKKGADAVKGKVAPNWARWADDRLRLPRLLARALWRDVVRLLLVAPSSSPAALTRVVHLDVMSLLRPGKKYRDGYVVDEDGRQQMMFTRAQALDVPTVEMGAIPHLLSRGVELLGSIQAHKVVRHFVVAGHEQAIAGVADARVLRYVGGWGNLAKRAGINSNQEDARAIIVALAHAPHALPDGTHGNLLAYSSRPHAPGRQSVVSVVLGDMLLPHFVFTIEGKSRTAIENRQLVPVVDLPAFIGRPNEHGAQASFQMMLMARFRAAARELYREGSVHIPRDQMETIAHRAGLTTALLAKVLELWTRDSDGPAFLVRTTTDKYTLAPHFGPALAYMKAAGSMSQARVAAGKASVARRGRPRKARRKAEPAS